MCITKENYSQFIKKKQYRFCDIQIIHNGLLKKDYIKQNYYYFIHNPHLFILAN